MTLVDITTLSGEDLRHLAYLADQRAERAEERIAEMYQRPALGRFKTDSSPGDHLTAWEDALAKQEAQHLAHPEQLAIIVRQIAEFTDDKELIVRAAVLHAERCGIPRDIFVPIITEAMREVIYGR